MPRCLRCQGCLHLDREPFTEAVDIACWNCGWRKRLVEPAVVALEEALRWTTTLCGRCHEAPVMPYHALCAACRGHQKDASHGPQWRVA